VVTPEALATRAGITTPLTAGQREMVRDAILAAQSDVYSYLGREIMPVTHVETGRWAYESGWEFDTLGDDPLIAVVSAVAEVDVVSGLPTGYFTLTYTCGINVRDDPTYYPIKRYVIAHALYSPEFTTLWKTSTNAKGEVKSLSAEGQSVSFEEATLSGNTTTGTKPGDLTPGTLPTLASLDRWRVAGRRVHQAASNASEWPFTGRRW
jgi:hypothetical protein